MTETDRKLLTEDLQNRTKGARERVGRTQDRWNAGFAAGLAAGYENALLLLEKYRGWKTEKERTMHRGLWIGSRDYTAWTPELTRAGRECLKRFEDCHRFDNGETFPAVVNYGVTRIGGGRCHIAYTVDTGRKLEHKTLIYRYGE